MTENHPADDGRDVAAAPSELPGPAGPPPAASADLPEQMRVRLGKRAALREAGVDPYPVGFPRTATIAEIRTPYAGLPPDTATGDFVFGMTAAFLIEDGKITAPLRDCNLIGNGPDVLQRVDAVAEQAG